MPCVCSAELGYSFPLSFTSASLCFLIFPTFRLVDAQVSYVDSPCCVYAALRCQKRVYESRRFYEKPMNNLIHDVTYFTVFLFEKANSIAEKFKVFLSSLTGHFSSN